MCVCLCVCVCVYIYICICVYIYIKYVYASTFNRVARLPFKDFLLNNESSHAHQQYMGLSFSLHPHQSDECEVIFHFYLLFFPFIYCFSLTIVYDEFLIVDDSL